jgi:hypothetical protein
MRNSLKLDRHIEVRDDQLEVVIAYYRRWWRESVAVRGRLVCLTVLLLCEIVSL